MPRIDDIPTSRADTRAHPATLLALAFGIMIGAYLSSVPARSAEAENTPKTERVGLAPSAFGTPRRVRTVRVLANHVTAPAAAAPKVAE
ncbi:hypothetical protein [Methylobacterium gnaphalii]|uniref:Uncharacterized protein n=1 Tax=Methylobacterium gnaphalii TaxID=1010610 RepID=A0A512JLE2_9HYPH|nr:hypothetical protein [Methylobacterium gnaphalii]GEP10770.1 hypothetical protein MGN01_26150 [Methylobacterium gnaphalii]GJD67358.1 hypothetical protein MMMDOFMJ_0273 [Methylobacterium gnaphalii]GLS49309.1 hypothetical protein GCM10007885_21570 [Methylobacterium gnaphalii]